MRVADFVIGVGWVIFWVGCAGGRAVIRVGVVLEHDRLLSAV
jgi:hypothetical protein